MEFRIACKAWEFEQIHQLNHLTFAGELPQHTPRPDGRLVDRFHHENTYLIATDGASVAGMVAVRGQRPFSLDLKLPDLLTYLPEHRNSCEIRLLSVRPEHRKGAVFSGLMTALAEYAISQHYDLALISGTLREERMYRQMGFVPFGPQVGTGGAHFQPMYMTSDGFMDLCRRRRLFRGQATRLSAGLSASSVPREILNLLPGPVSMSPLVRRELSAEPVSHRGGEFLKVVAQVRAALCALTGAARVALFSGGGTLANDVVAAHLARMEGEGLVWVGGEFGRRLAEQGRAARLRFRTLENRPGTPLEASRLRRELAMHPEVRWVWTVHCETETGVLNNLSALSDVCREAGVRLAVDGVSSLGTVPLCLSGVCLASASSGKGLAAAAGLALVFHDHPVAPAEGIPHCIDLGRHTADGGVPHTIASGPVLALRAALLETDWPTRFTAIAEASRHLRWVLLESGYPVLAPEQCASPAVLSVDLPARLSSRHVGDRLERLGVRVSYQSAYLLAANRIQLCLMGHRMPQLEMLNDALRSAFGEPALKQRRATPA
ncbi:MAG: aminotransferase class V-fold PLP-dependent enzyme [Nitrospirota bacterium]|nr:aminotransferase class V-fold PLP-dependent enzyme [Nitrospirota bacterium]